MAQQTAALWTRRRTPYGHGFRLWWVAAALGLASCGGGGTDGTQAGPNASAVIGNGTSEALSGVIFSGNTTPLAAIGSNGDYYLNAQTGQLFGPKADSVWPTASISLLGQAGPAGLAGAVGDTGPVGPVGPAGATGTRLLSGTVAPANNLGRDGDFYLNASAKTIIGPKTLQAWPTTGTSIVGSVGMTGATGARGATGLAGSSLLSGSGIPNSAVGANGDHYIDTTDTRLFGPKSANVWPESGVLLTGKEGAAGAMGATGAKGASVLSGIAAPPDTLGTNGDLYFNTTTSTLLGPKTANAWPVTGTVLKGSQGAKGEKGAKGDAGAVGATGAKGDAGAVGATGAKGDVGATGAKGDAGAVGATGAKGDAGAVGATGAKGDAGAVGATGAKGDAGAVGATGAKGDVGAVGATGAKGDVGAVGATGAKGDVGAVGATGAKGDAGAVGAKGAKGEKGATGAKGAKGEKGEKGDSGATGAKGTDSAGVVYGFSSLNASTASWYSSISGSTIDSDHGPEYSGIAMPVACSFKTLVVSARYISGVASNTLSVTLVKNAVNQTLACRLTAVAPGNTYSCSVRGTVPVVVGDVMGLKFTQSVMGASSPFVRISVGTTCQ